MKILINPFIKISILALLSFLILISCNDKQTKDPNSKIESVLLLTTQNIKMYGLPKMYTANMQEDSLKSLVIKESAKAMYNYRMKFTMTKICLKEKQKNGSNKIEEKKQYLNDSTYLSLLKIKSEEIDKHSIHGNNNPTIENLIIGIEKIKSLIKEMNGICTTENKGKLMK